VKRVLLVFAASVALAACGDLFSPPPLPDLYKDPYDFSVTIPPYRDGGTSDMKPTAPRDLASSLDHD
jgi:hypothetical protein